FDGLSSRRCDGELFARVRDGKHAFDAGCGSELEREHALVALGEAVDVEERANDGGVDEGGFAQVDDQVLAATKGALRRFGQVGSLIEVELSFEIDGHDLVSRIDDGDDRKMVLCSDVHVSSSPFAL